MNAPSTDYASAPRRPRVLAILTCFNRKALTLACLDALDITARRAQVDLEAIVVDDASPDGTATAVRERFGWAQVVEGNGSLFWNGGMHKGFGLALGREADHYLWLNDDTHLVPDALPSLLQQSADLTRANGSAPILVGATAERDSGRVSYGGRVARSRLRPFNFHLVHSDSEPVPCQAIEGNCVLIPRAVALRVGNLDPVFEHAMGDTDYGLRAQALGVRTYVARGIVGHCSPNPLGGTYFDTSLPLSRRWKLIRSRKGLPVRSWRHFCRRHGGPLWPVHFAWPYAKVLLTGVRGLFVRQPAGTTSAKLT
ncbi:MAG: glycosyltransferase family 2 protein [Rubrivivax sp.]|nr:glycosyltransferase family 2 protein [Rubrivivax sp.]